MRAIILFVTALVTAAYPQQGPFLQVATTDDARQIYVWSRVPLKTESIPYDSLGLFQLSEGSITRVFGDRELPLSNRIVARVNLHVSGGGQTLLWTEVTRCVGGSACIGSSPSGSALSRLLRAGMQEPQVLAGRVQISHSGRYLLHSSEASTTLQDLDTGMQWMVPVRPLSGERAVTSDGRVLGVDISQTGRLVLWSPSQVDTLMQLTSTSAEAVISDDGQVVLYRSAEGFLMRMLTRERGNIEALGVGSDAMLSNNGELALFRREGECWMVRRGRPEAERLLAAGTQAVACTLAGFGTAAVALTEIGQVLKIDLTTPGTVTELVPPTPYGFVGGALSPGGVLTWKGQGQVRVLLNGSPMPIIRNTPGDIWLQAPFDLLVDGPTQRLEVETPSPFGIPPQDVTVLSRAPYFLTDGNLIAAHEDFRGLVSQQDPAQPGETVHLWAVGLGAVTPNVSAGEPAPSSFLTRLVAPFDCRVLRGEDLPVTFAGLAPGMTGIYQVDVKLPAVVSENSVFLSCGTTGVEAERHGGWLPIRSQ